MENRVLTDEPNSWSLLVSVIFIAVFSAVSWFASPKGENQTVWRSTLILSACSCWLMWGTYSEELMVSGHVYVFQRLTGWLAAVTFLAQWHPLIAPERSDLRLDNGPTKPGSMF